MSSAARRSREIDLYADDNDDNDDDDEYDQDVDEAI
jgi:hypothetical protein